MTTVWEGTKAKKWILLVFLFFTKLGQRIMHHYSNDTFIISSKKRHYTDYFLVLFAMFFNQKKGCIVYLINSKVKKLLRDKIK